MAPSWEPQIYVTEAGHRLPETEGCSAAEGQSRATHPGLRGFKASPWNGGLLCCPKPGGEETALHDGEGEAHGRPREADGDRRLLAGQSEEAGATCSGLGRASTFSKGVRLRPSHPWPHLRSLLSGPGPPTAPRPDVWVANRSERQDAGGGDRMGPQTDAKFKKKESQGNREKQGLQHKSVQMTGEKQRQMGPASLTSKVATSQHCEGPPRCPCPAGLSRPVPRCPLPPLPTPAPHQA